MSYARSRLWLGVTGVGSIVTIAFIALVFGWPERFLSSDAHYGGLEFLQLAALTGIFMVWLFPFDYLGGYLLPRRFQKSEQAFGTWLKEYSAAAFTQAFFFLCFGSAIILSAQAYGLVGALATISVGIVCCFSIRNRRLLHREVRSEQTSKKLLEATSLTQSWQTNVPHTVVVKHKDIGFTGGIVGFGKRAQIVIPQAWLSFSQEQLATAIARRATAVNSGSYSRGLMVAFLWNVCGFLVCSLISETGLATVAGLATTISGFTLWSFLGLLTLPTLSRSASLEIDSQLQQQGMPADLISKTAFTMDQLQDGEPDRSPWIETIFHPVPNVTSRNPEQPVRGFGAWNVARTTLFFSWACLGFLSRSVHCNVGRPELWTMLPTD